MHVTRALTLSATCALSSYAAALSSAPRGSVSNELNINFAPCGPADELPPDFECGHLIVPIDHENPETGTIELWVSRRPASGNGASPGTLFFNPGGPGGAASDIFKLLVSGFPALSQNLLDNYNIIALDPRGIGYSNPLECDPNVWQPEPSRYAVDEDSFIKLLAYNKAAGESCTALSGPLLRFMDSTSTAKDMELLRLALDIETFDFLGSSYGTLLGQTYAELYPKQVGRFVFDGVADHSDGQRGGILTEAQGLEATLQQFFEWCNTTTDCALHGKDVATLFDSVTRANSTVPVTGQHDASGDEIIYQTQTGLEFQNLGDKASWAKYSVLLNETIFGNNSTGLVNRQGPRNVDFASRAVLCQDYGTFVNSPEDFASLEVVATALTPHTRGIGLSLSAAAYCVGWPAPVSHPPRKLNPEKVAQMPPMLLVSSFIDPESSSRWALGVRDQIPQAINVFRKGSGHTSYWLMGETSKAMDQFLLTGFLPKDATVYNA